mmetsp:Transcript_32425/g.71366  ORF Transcript_32425/g.71366 Transcript_32425/m.71366 type:complete len:254 (-) Transcript_32425:3-764(-)
MTLGCLVPVCPSPVRPPPPVPTPQVPVSVSSVSISSRHLQEQSSSSRQAPQKLCEQLRIVGAACRSWQITQGNFCFSCSHRREGLICWFDSEPSEVREALSRLRSSAALIRALTELITAELFANPPIILYIPSLCASDSSAGKQASRMCGFSWILSHTALNSVVVTPRPTACLSDEGEATITNESGNPGISFLASKTSRSSAAAFRAGDVGRWERTPPTATAPAASFRAADAVSCICYPRMKKTIENGKGRVE